MENDSPKPETVKPKKVTRISRRRFLQAGMFEVAALTLAACGLAPSKNKVSSPTVPVVPHTPIPPIQENKSTPVPTKLVNQEKSKEVQATPTVILPKIEKPDTEPLPSNPGIMFLGDSLIALGQVPTLVASSLEAANIQAHFVGDIQSAANKVPYEGHGGFDTKRMAAQLCDDKVKVWTELNGKETVKNFNQHIPDIVVIQLCTNDVANIALYNKSGTSIDIDAYSISYYEKIIDYLRSKNPNVRIIVSKVPLTQHPDVNKFVADINKHLDTMASELTTKKSAVITTPDWIDRLNPNTDLADDYHPNSTGQKTMADQFTKSILQIMDL